MGPSIGGIESSLPKGALLLTRSQCDSALTCYVHLVVSRSRTILFRPWDQVMGMVCCTDNQRKHVLYIRWRAIIVIFLYTASNTRLGGPPVSMTPGRSMDRPNHVIRHPASLERSASLGIFVADDETQGGDSHVYPGLRVLAVIPTGYAHVN